MVCGWGERNVYTGLVPIQINHIDGNPHNHDLSNVELLCPGMDFDAEFDEVEGYESTEP